MMKSELTLRQIESYHQGMRSLMLDARLGKMVMELAEVNGSRIWHDQALIK